MINVLYITAESGSPLGSAFSLKDLLDSVRKNVVPYVVVRNKEAAVFFEKFGYKSFVIDYPLDFTSSKGIKRIFEFIPRLIRDKLKYKKALENLQKICKDYNIKIIHSNNSVVDIGYRLSKVTGIPHVWHIRELMDSAFNWTPFLGWKYFYKDLYNSDCTISITKAISEHYGLSSKKNAYQFFDAVRSVNEIVYSKEKEHFFMFCGNITPTKGADTAVKAFGIFCKNNNQYRLKFIGSIAENYKNDLFKIANEYGVKDKIDFEGYQEDTKKYYVKATAYLMCSKHEAQGRVTVEAMFYGCPVIGFDGGGTTEIIKNGETGFLFKTEEECAACMDKVIKDNNIQSLIYSAQEEVKNNFSIESYGVKITNIYNTLTNKL